MSLIERAIREKIVLVGVTLPPATDDTTEASLDELARLVDTAGADEAARVMKAVADAGVDLDDVFRVLEDEGVQKFVDACVEQAKVLGVTLPDSDLKWNEARGHNDFGPIDWDEFWRVVGGDGPCNRERLAARVKAWEDGAWVREAALAHAAKLEPRCAA